LHDVRGLQLVGVAVVGCSLGFLPWNAPSARMFLGDVGSYLFGGLVTSGLLLGMTSGVPILPLLAPLAIYAADTGAALVRRLVRGQPLLHAHREHIYQRLVSTGGMSHLAVSVGAAILAVVVTASWLFGETWLSVSVTVLVLSLYLASPRLLALGKALSVDARRRAPL